MSSPAARSLPLALALLLCLSFRSASSVSFSLDCWRRVTARSSPWSLTLSVTTNGTAAVKKELHRLLSWSFNSTLEENSGPTPSSAGTQPGQAPVGAMDDATKPSSKLLLIKVLVPVASVLAFVVCVGVCLLVDQDGSSADFEIGMGWSGRDGTPTASSPLRPTILQRGISSGKEVLAACTRAASIMNDGQQVAIKRFSSGSSSLSSSSQSHHGRKEFEAEVRIISRLRHRNLVQLLGWSDSPKGLLLVYELVPEGSLES